MSTAGHYSTRTRDRACGAALSYLAVAFTLLGLTACSGESSDGSDDKSAAVSYSFFVAGHTYGKTSNQYKAGEQYDGRVHPPFREHFDLIRNNPSMQFGFFAGDIVKDATAESWDRVDQDLAELRVPVHLAVGNHDVSDRELFESRYGPTYYSFRHRNDLFVVLDPNLDGWNISGPQLSFLRETLVDLASVANVFVVGHQMLWWDSTNRFAEVRPNSEDNRADSINFWSDVEPLLRSTNKHVYLFAGDIGAHRSWRSCMYYRYDKITFIATGMGGGRDDNFVIVNVVKNDSVTFDLIALNGDDIHALGDLEDHTPPRSLFQRLRDLWHSR